MWVLVAVVVCSLALNVIGARRSRPLRLSTSGLVAFAVAVASSLLILDGMASVQDGAAGLALIFGTAALAYFIAAPWQPYRFLPAFMLSGFADELEAACHDDYIKSHQARVAIPFIVLAIGAGAAYAFM